MNFTQNIDQKKIHSKIKEEISKGNTKFRYDFQKKANGEDEATSHILQQENGEIQIWLLTRRTSGALIYSFQEKGKVGTEEIDEYELACAPASHEEFQEIEKRNNDPKISEANQWTLNEVLKTLNIDFSECINDKDTKEFNKYIVSHQEKEEKEAVDIQVGVIIDEKNNKANITIDNNSYILDIRKEGSNTSPRRFHPYHTYIFTSPLLDNKIFLKLGGYREDGEGVIMNYH